MDSTRFSGMAPQLTVMNGFPARSDPPWIARAINSLPTPDSPSTKIGMFDCAARVPSRNTWRISELRATRSSNRSRLSLRFFSRVTSPDRVPILSALRIETVMRSGFAGLTRKSLAPARIASTAESMPPLAVSTITGNSLCAARNRVSTVMPSTSGITRSKRTSAICSPRGPRSRSSAGPPPGAVTAAMPALVIAASRSLR